MNHAYREEGKKPRKKKKKHHLYAAIVLTLGVVIICLAILILFYVQRIEIKGNVYCTDKMIAEAVRNDRFSINTLYVTAKYAMGKGEIPEVLEDMEVRLKNPWTLRVTVQEKQSIGYIEYKNQRVYFDKEGFVIHQGTAIMKDAPQIKGINFKNIKLYQKMECENSSIFEEISMTMEELKKNKLSTNKILYVNDRMHIYIDKICVSLGMDVTAEKIAQIKPIMKKLEDREGTLHLENYSDGNETITFAIDEFPEEK